MASVKVKFRPSSSVGRAGTIHYYISHRGISRIISTPYCLFPTEWNSQYSIVICDKNTPRMEYLLEIRHHIRCDLERINTIIRMLERERGRFSADDIVSEFSLFARRYSLFNFMQAIIERLKTRGRIRTAETYTSALNSFRTFRKGNDIRLDFLTPGILEDFSVWHASRGNCPNTISFYNRILRAVYNRALNEASFGDSRPFRNVYTGVSKTKKRALPIKIIRHIRLLDLSSTPLLDYARDIFILSFMLRGMSFIDMAFLRKSDLRRGVISYRRRKTGRRLTIAWTADMQRILEKYPDNDTPYLLPILRHHTKDSRTAYRNRSYSINRSLKRLSSNLGLPHPLTLYVARHSWANAAREKGIPMNVISEGMGHDRESTTRVYLSELDTTIIDKANSIIIEAIK